MDLRRITRLNPTQTIKSGPVAYWMSRDQRVWENWALIHAQNIAKQNGLPLVVVFSLNPKFLDATIRQYKFMIDGLMEVEKDLNELNISFFLLEGDPTEEIVRFVKNKGVSYLVTDFSPLKISRKWKESISKKIDIPFDEVDAHNIVPCLIASNKQEFGAYTIRPKINKLLPEFLTPFPSIHKNEHTIQKEKIDWKKVFDGLDINFQVKPVDWVKPGYTQGMQTLKNFIENNAKKYNELRNDPNEDVQSGLSPYLHFGQISAQKVALEINDKVRKSDAESFLEELIIRRELSDNYCYFNYNYDNPEGYPDWAKKSLAEHSKDKREYIYTKHELEIAKTHDPLWNAAQNELTRTGKMHSYLRMYWAKKILEWSETIEDAHKIAIYLNDKYELDGRDPNGYTGIAWSLGGVHDRAWFERPIFGKIRYMNYNGAKNKFDVDKYISKNNN